MRKNLSLIVIVLSLLFSKALLATETPYTGGPYAIPGVIQAENYDFGLEGESYHDTSPGNAFGVYRGDSMDVGPITAGGYFIGNLANGEWAKYTVNVAAAGNYNLTYRYSSNTTLVTSFRVLLNGTPPAAGS
jgi:arabinoxylan arabinofuranohydrolase